MKHAVAKTFRTIFIVLAVILLVLTVFLYYIDAPVIEEGQEPTVAQKVILLGKKYLGEILAICGVSALGLIGVLVKLIYNSANSTTIASQSTAKDVVMLHQRLSENEAQLSRITSILNGLCTKQDIANNTLLTTFSLSELPASLRTKISDAQTAYNELGKAKEIAEQVIEKTENTVQPEPSDAEVPETSEKPVEETVAEKATPRFL